jgi:thiamine-monophosphate kinase
VRENSLVRWLNAYPQPNAKHVPLGIGDDAAVMRWANSEERTVITTDLIADGTHFLSGQHSPAQIGRKAMAVNLSDIAAMAAEPVAAFISLLLPRNTSDEYTKQLMAAAIDLANSFDCVVAGGDTNVWSGDLAINVLVVGRVPDKPLLRSGANAGDSLLVTGALGGSIHGHHLEFMPRIREALWLKQNFPINAGMDLSDGLAMDLRRLCVASGCGAEIDSAALPISSHVDSKDMETRIQCALGDGEDFELLLAVPSDTTQDILNHPDRTFPISVVGHCTHGADIWLKTAETKKLLPAVGYEHQ